MPAEDAVDAHRDPARQKVGQRRHAQQEEDDDQIALEGCAHSATDGDVQLAVSTAASDTMGSSGGCDAVGSLGHDVLFGQQLDEVGQRLVPGRADAPLQARDHPPVDPVEGERADEQESEAWEDQHLISNSDH